jgi:hypothetical protein
MAFTCGAAVVLAALAVTPAEAAGLGGNVSDRRLAGHRPLSGRLERPA